MFLGNCTLCCTMKAENNLCVKSRVICLSYLKVSPCRRGKSVQRCLPLHCLYPWARSSLSKLFWNTASQYWTVRKVVFFLTGITHEAIVQESKKYWQNLDSATHGAQVFLSNCLPKRSKYNTILQKKTKNITIKKSLSWKCLYLLKELGSIPVDVIAISCLRNT